jgi:LytS/YehU family sensor histidine kinase
MVALQEELDFIKPYLYLLEKRFGEGLRVSLDIDPSALNKQVVPVALQMLVENAIKHNVVSARKPLTVRIMTPGAEELVVENDLQPRLEKEPSTQVGLENIGQRLRLTTGKELVVEQTDTVFRVKLPLIYS